MITWRASRMSHQGMAASPARPVRHPAKFLAGILPGPLLSVAAEGCHQPRRRPWPARWPALFSCPALRRADVLAHTGQRHSHASPPSNRVTRSRHYPRQIPTFRCPVSMHNHASSRAIGAGTTVVIVSPELRQGRGGMS